MKDLSHETFLDYKSSHVLQCFVRVVITAQLFQSFFSVFLQKMANLARMTIIIDAETEMIDSYTKLDEKFKKNSLECWKLLWKAVLTDFWLIFAEDV